MSRKIFFPAILEGVRTRSDRTLAITFGTQELSPEDAGVIFSMLQSMMYVAVKEEMFTREEEKVLDELQADAVEFQGKTPSQRLRAVLYKNFQIDNQGFSTFTRYYEHQMERIVNAFKSKLED
jgi:hypothetical protein